MSRKELEAEIRARMLWDKTKSAFQWMVAIAVILGIIGLLWFGIKQLF
jgi:hypothetical protein